MIDNRRRPACRQAGMIEGPPRLRLGQALHKKERNLSHFKAYSFLQKQLLFSTKKYQKASFSAEKEAFFSY